MVQRTIIAPDTEPEQSSFQMPSEDVEHLLQVVDVFDMDYEQNKFNLDMNTVFAKCEVVGGDEEGRSLLNRLSLDATWKGFFATRLFLKAIGEPHKGEILIDTDKWIGKQFYATVVHNKSKDGRTFANIDQYNLEKVIEEVGEKKVESPEDIAWDE